MNVQIFKPFRLFKGKVIVMSYMAWRKVAIETKKGTILQLDANLHIVPQMPVVDYKCEQLFWFTDEAFNEFPIVEYPYSVSHRLYDCEGVPVFSHIDKKRIANEPYLYRPLMTNDVVREFHIMAEKLHVRYTRSLDVAKNEWLVVNLGNPELDY